MSANPDVYNRTNGITPGKNIQWQNMSPAYWAQQRAAYDRFWKSTGVTSQQWADWYKTLSPDAQKKASTELFQAQGAFFNPDTSFEKAMGIIAPALSIGALTAGIGAVAGAGVGAGVGGASGASIGSGAGSAIGAGAGSAAGTAAGGALGSAVGSGVGAGVGAGTGALMAGGDILVSGLGGGAIGSGIGAGIGAGIGSGIGAGVGLSGAGGGYYDTGGLQANNAYQGGVTDTGYGGVGTLDPVTVNVPSTAGSGFGSGLTGNQLAGLVGAGALGVNALASGGASGAAGSSGTIQSPYQPISNPTQTTDLSGVTPDTSSATLPNVTTGGNMGWLDYLKTGASIYSAISGSNAAKDASAAQAAAAEKAAQLQYQQFLQQRQDQLPFLQAGYGALNRENMLLGLSGDKTDPAYGSLNTPFGMDQFQQDPGYAFRMSEGLKALDRQAAARGGLISGGALKAAEGYGQDMASQEYQNAFNRYQVNRSNILNPLQAMSGQGQSSANTLAGASQSYANNAGNAYIGAGNARASGYVGSANAINNGIGSIANYFAQQQMLQQLYPNGVNG